MAKNSFAEKALLFTVNMVSSCEYILAHVLLIDRNDGWMEVTNWKEIIVKVLDSVPEDNHHDFACRRLTCISFM